MDHCQHCNKGFATRSSLKRHIHAKHPNELDGSKKGSMVHSCSHCHRNFTRSESLRRHTLNKHGRGPSLCSFCQKPFRADFMSQHGPRCARKYWERVRKHASLGVGDEMAQFKTTPNIIQLGLQDSQGRNASRLSSNDSPISEDEHHNICIVHEFKFDARLTADAFEATLLYFEEADDMEAYKEALVAAFRLNIIFDCEGIRPHEERESDHFHDLAELALMIDEVNRDHASINTTGEFGMTILHLACASGLAELLEPLFWRCASFAELDEEGYTPLSWAVRSGDLDTVHFALALGADPNSGNHLTRAWSAGRRDMVTDLVKYGADVNASYNGSRALERAILGEDLDGVRLLLSLGADANLAAENEAYSMFRMMKGCGHRDNDYCVHEQIALILLEHGVDVSRTDTDGNTLLHLAINKAHIRLLRAMLSRTTSPEVLHIANDDGWTALHLAIQKSDKHSTHRKLTMVSVLVEAGADINSRSDNGYTTLDLAAGDGNEVLVELLLEAGANVTTLPNCRHSALTLAARRGNEGIVRMLIAAGADVDLQDEDGDSALILATEGDHVQIILLLLDAGADINTRTRGGETALFIAVAYNYERIVRLLLDTGADVDVRAMSEETALSLAVESDKKELVRYLLDAGANIDIWTLVEPMRTFVETVLGEPEFRARAEYESNHNDESGRWWTD